MGANAQTTVPTFTTGQVLTATQMNDSARTGVPVFATTVERDAAFGGSGEKTLAEGQLCYLESTNVVQYYDGAAWATVGPTSSSFTWTAYTPTWTNLTPGNGTVDFKYCQIDKFVAVLGNFKLGSTSSVSGSISFTTPVTMAAPTVSVNTMPRGTASLRDVGVDVYSGLIYYATTTTVGLGYWGQAGTSANGPILQLSTSSSAPFTWANTDEIGVEFIFQAA